MVEELVLGGIYQHYKGRNYRVLDLARHSETHERVVIYECLYENPEGRIWVRPLGMFLETLSHEGRVVPRFKYIGSQKGRSRL